MKLPMVGGEGRERAAEAKEGTGWEEGERDEEGQGLEGGGTIEEAVEEVAEEADSGGGSEGPEEAKVGLEGPEEARVGGVMVVAAVAAGCRGEYRPNPLNRCRQGGRQLRSRAGERIEHCAIGTAQCAAKLEQRHRIDPADGTGEQCLGGVAVESAFGGGQHGDKRTDAGVVDDGTADGRRINGNTGY